MNIHFLFCLVITASIYSCGTLLYYSQTFLSYAFFSPEIITQMLSGWDYLAQAAGIVLYMLLYRYRSGITGRRQLQAILSLLFIPIIFVSVFTKSGTLLVTAILLLNLLVGLQTAYSFTLIAAHLTRKNFTLCFAGAYSIGGMATYLISRINTEIMISFRVIIITCILAGFTASMILLYKDADDSAAKSPIPASTDTVRTDTEISPINRQKILHLAAIIALMAVIIALGTNDPILVTSGSQLSFLVTRVFYAIGLLTAALLFDRSPVFGGICTLASILYPILVIILYQELPMNSLAVALTDTFVGFYAVYRAGTFFSIASARKKLFLAALGLCVSRVVEGIMTIVIQLLGFDRLTSFLLAGVMFVPLILLFCSLLLRTGDHREDTPAPAPLNRMPASGAVLPASSSESQAFVNEIPTLPVQVEYASRKAENPPSESISLYHTPSFARLYSLTRRENEIAMHLSENRTNGEIAALLCVSESTVRFHVSNLLKKTGMKSRNEVGEAYRVYARRIDENE